MLGEPCHIWVAGRAGISILAFVTSHVMQGGWLGLLTALCGALLFTLGTMSHDKTTSGQESKSHLTLSAAAIAALLSRMFYIRALIGVSGELRACCIGVVLAQMSEHPEYTRCAYMYTTKIVASIYQNACKPCYLQYSIYQAAGFAVGLLYVPR